MTEINRIHAQRYSPFRGPGATRPSRRPAQRITVTRSQLVNDEPIEEVIFEPNDGVDQRAMQRGYAITEPIEDVLIERRDRALRREHFWQGFSAPFMAQVIGQHIDRPTPRPQGYGRAATTIERPAGPRLSTAC